MTSLRPKATFGSILKYKHEICSMPTTKFPAVAAALCTILAAGSLSAKAPIFMPIKVDGPVHAPEKGSFWYGPFAEGSAVFDLNGDGWLDITCGRNWYEGPNWVKHTEYRENSKTFGEFQDNNGEVAYDVDRDGDTDLIGSGWMGNGIFWYENPGRPLEPGEQWVTHKIHDTEWTEGFMVADVDSDGDRDIILNHWDPKEGQFCTWLELQPGPVYIPHHLGTAGDMHGVGLGDVNGDGRNDLVTREGWYEAPADPHSDKWAFHADWNIEEHASIPILVMDVDQDGLNDLIYGNAHGYGLFWMQQANNGGKRRFTRHVIDEDNGQYHTFALVDLNGDGVDDLVTGKRLRGHNGEDQSAFDPLFLFWFDIQKGAFIRHPIVYNHLAHYPGAEERNPVPQMAIGIGMNINVADVNKDGRMDIVVGGKSGLYILENRGFPPTQPMVKR